MLMRHSVHMACTCALRARRVRTACAPRAHCVRAHRACTECVLCVCTLCRDFELEIIRDDATAIAIGAQYISDDEKLCFLDPNVLKPPDGTCFTTDELKAFFKKLAGKPAPHALDTT